MHWREGVCWPSAERGTHAGGGHRESAGERAEGFYESEKGHDDRFRYWQWRTEKGRRAERRHHSEIAEDAGREVERNSGASLIDLGDGVVCCEFQRQNEPIGADLIAMLHKGLKRLETDFDAMVIANQAVNFSVGANLMLVLVGAQEQSGTNCTWP